MIMPIMKNNDAIISGPFSDNYKFSSSSYTTSEEYLTSRMQDLTITPKSTIRIRFRSVSFNTETSTQTMSTISQREMTYFGCPWSPTHPINHDFILYSGYTHHMAWNPHFLQIL